MSVLLLVMVGVVGGLVASAVMEAFQALAAKPFGATGGGEPATVKAADSASVAATGEAVTQKRRMRAGTLVHYATGVALGVVYVVLVQVMPAATCGFGAVFGIAVALILDDLVVPALGWGAWPSATPLNIHAYGLASHIVFGVVLEAVRRGGVLLLA